LPWQGNAAARAADALPFRVSLLMEDRDGPTWHAGVRIVLDEGWITYWRIPGDSGIPPEFDWSNSQGVGAVTVSYPIPQRYIDQSGEAVGYKNEVVFPLTVTATSDDPHLDLALFFATCKDVCIPASAALNLDLGAAAITPVNLSAWRRLVPQPGVIATTARAEGDDHLRLTLETAVADIFVEGAESVYFHAPRFENNGTEAVIAVSGAGGATPLAGMAIKLTAPASTGALEQVLTVA
jgi:DsbC/DsbD-like thiol-disulfide interchange protein